MPSFENKLAATFLFTTNKHLAKFNKLEKKDQNKIRLGSGAQPSFGQHNSINIFVFFLLETKRLLVGLICEEVKCKERRRGG